MGSASSAQGPYDLDQPRIRATGQGLFESFLESVDQVSSHRLQTQRRSSLGQCRCQRLEPRHDQAELVAGPRSCAADVPSTNRKPSTTQCSPATHLVRRPEQLGRAHRRPEYRRACGPPRGTRSTAASHEAGRRPSTRPCTNTSVPSASLRREAKPGVKPVPADQASSTGRPASASMWRRTPVGRSSQPGTARGRADRDGDTRASPDRVLGPVVSTGVSTVVGPAVGPVVSTVGWAQRVGRHAAPSCSIRPAGATRFLPNHPNGRPEQAEPDRFGVG